MARIRTIKPEFWTSEQVIECSTNARLLFIGLWNFCDDRGRMVFSPKRIKACIFPSDDFTSENVLGMVSELESNGLLRVYTVDGKDFLAVTGWHHQRIDKPQKAQTPEPPDDKPPTTPRTFGDGEDRIGEDRKGKEKNSNPGPADSHPARTLNAATPASPVATEAGPGRADGWNTRANFDRIEARCRADLPGGGPQDLRIGPMAQLEHSGYDLEAEIIPALLDVAAGARTPIRTWTIFAERCRERIDSQRQTRAAQGLATTTTPPGEMHDMGASGMVADAVLRKIIAVHRESGKWFADIFGPAPGQPGCRVPAKLLLEAA